MKELPIIQKTYDLIKWYIPLLNRLPRDHKFNLGDRIITGLYELLESLIIARFQKEKLSQLEALNSKLDILRYQTRLLLDFNLINAHRYEYAAKLLNEIGTDLGGWVKQQKSKDHIMKRYGNLWTQITDFSNLLSAAQKAQKGKRFRANILAFNYNLEQELQQLQTELQTKTYIPGEYRTFEIKEPKPRMISAAPYRDRVVHHALCNVIAPIFERTLIHDCYANRVGFGSHRALRRFTKFARSSKYVLQCDIRKYFPSIDHEILKSILRRKIKCPDALWLIDTLIDGQQSTRTDYSLLS